MANPAPTINQINAFNATQGTTIDFNIIGGTELIRSNRIYIYDLSDNSLICTHLYVSTESIHELPPNTDGSIVYESGKSSADFVNGAQYYAQIQTYTDTNGTQGGSGLSVAKMFWCLGDPTLTITTIPSTISTTSYNVSATYTDTSASVVSNIIQQYQFNLYSATGSLLQSSGVVVGSGMQQGTSAVYDISHNFTGLNVGSSYYVTVDVTTTQGVSVNAQSNTFTVSIDTPTLGEATVVNNACDGYISVTSNLSGEYGGSGSGEIVSFETDSEDIFTKLQVDLEPTQEGSGTPSPSNVRPIKGHSGVDVNVRGANISDDEWESGDLGGGTGVEINDLNYIRSANFILCPPSTEFWLQSDARAWVFWFDENRQYISNTGGVPTLTGVTVTSPNNAKYFRLTTNQTSYASPVIFNYPSTDHDYHEYNAQTITQDFNATLTPTSTDTTPYSFKAVGDVYGDRLEDKIVGGTVAWNQMCSPRNDVTVSGVTFSPLADGVITLSGTATASIISLLTNNIYHADGHKYLFRLETIANPNDLAFVVGVGSGQPWISNAGTVGAHNVVYTSTYTISLGLYYVEGLNLDGVKLRYVLHDLTQMFGSTIADYIYSLEQSQAGAGVAWFKKLFPKDYYEYNAGELLSVEGLSAHVMRDADNNVIGNYPLDSSLTLRGIPKLDASNNLYYDGDEYTSDGKVKRKYGVYTIQASNVSLNNTAYTNISYAEIVSLPNMLKSLDKQCVHSKFGVGKRGYPFDDASRVGELLVNSSTERFWFGFAKGTTEEQMKSALDGTTIVYELATPTTETAQAYTNPQIVSKYGTLEYVTNSIVPVGHKTTYLTRDIFGGYVDLISGKLVVTHGYVDLGTLNWGYVSGGTRFYVPFPPIKTVANNNTKPNALCSLYDIGTPNDTWNTKDKVISSNTVEHMILVRDTTYTDPTAFKSAMNGVQLVYELATPQTYQLTPQQVNTLVGTNNVWSEQGNIELSYHIPITNLLVKRQDVDDVGGGWLTLYSQPISQASDMDFTFIDFLNQYGKTYKYALVPLLTQTQSGVEVEVEGGYTVSDEVQSVFDGVFIADSTGSQKCKANVGYGNVDMNQVVGSITPIGAKYPIIITNSHNQYHNGSISGTIVPDDYYFNGNLSRIDMVNKRNELEQFLTNKRVKVIKDWNGNIWLVMIVGNVSCTFNNNYGMGIVSFSTNWTEVGDPTNQQDLQATGLINVGGV